MKKYIFILLAVMVTLGLVAGVTFAQENSFDLRRSNGEYCYENEQMSSMMRENGFEEMAVFMENGDREGMLEVMRNLSSEDFERMQSIMNSYGPRNGQRMGNRIFRPGFRMGNRCR